MSLKDRSTASVVSPELREDYVKILQAELPEVLYEKSNLNDILFIILNALQNVSKNKYFGITTLTEVLKGIERPTICDNQLNTVAEFGLLKELSYETIRFIIEWMIANHLILKTKGKYPVLHSTHEGLHYADYVTVKTLESLKKYLEEEVVLWNESI